MINLDALFNQHFNQTHPGDTTPPIDLNHDVPLHDETEIGDMFETKVAGMVLDLERILHFIGAGVEVKGDTKNKLLSMAAHVTSIADGIEAQEDRANPLDHADYIIGDDRD